MRCDHALDHFELQHEVHVAHAVGVAREVKEQRRRDVVGQVAHEAHAARELAEVEVEGVGLMHHDAFVFQPSSEVAVELDDVKVGDALKKRARECAFAGADLDDEVAGRRID